MEEGILTKSIIDDNTFIGTKEENAKETNETINITSKLSEIEQRRASNKSNKLLTQTIAMTKKTVIIFLRNYLTTGFLILCPFIVSAFLIGLQFWFNTYSSSWVNPNPQLIALPKIPKCSIPKGCTTIGIAVIDQSKSDLNYKEAFEIASFLATENEWEIDKDIKWFNVTEYNEFTDYWEKNKNQTFYGVVICYDTLTFSIDTGNNKTGNWSLSVPCKPEFKDENKNFHFYTILYNSTLSPNDFMKMNVHVKQKDKYWVKLKNDIDNAYLSLFNNKYNKNESIGSAENQGVTSPRIKESIADFPMTEFRFLDHFDVVNNYGVSFFIMVPLSCFILILWEIVREKELKLRKSLIIIGLTNSAFWLSWIIICLFFAVLSSISLILFALIIRWEIFVNTPFPIMFSLFFLFTLDMEIIALVLSTVLSTMKSAYTVCFAFILTCFIIQSLFGDNIIYQFLYSVNSNFAVKFFKYFWFFYSPYNFSKAYVEIAAIAGSKFDFNTLTNTVGREYFYSDLFTTNENSLPWYNLHYIIPPTIWSIVNLVGNAVFYFLLAMYFDNVIESNRGISASPIFFIDTIINWFKCLKKRNLSNEKEQNTNLLANINANCFNQVHQTVLEERDKILKELTEKTNTNDTGLRIIGWSKTYILSNNKQLNALKQTFLDIKKSQLLTLIGHNGAGKTTLINMLSGNIRPTEGYAKICDIDILSNDNSGFERHHQWIGLCPQHDILFDELTPYEHIELYGIIRNYDKKDIPFLVENKLDEVHLHHVSNNKVSTFSGGMKRRISIILATIGNPNVMFLDEPSTGLDPVNRRFIWSMIKQLKKDKTVILTTHSMDEAEYLSDKLCIIKSGKLQCIGSPLEIKKIFGDGYVWTFVSNKGHEAEWERAILEVFKKGTIVSSKGGSIIFTSPYECVSQLNLFIMLLNKKFKNAEITKFQTCWKECGLTQTSIEEIFLKIAKDEKDVNDLIRCDET